MEEKFFQWHLEIRQHRATCTLHSHPQFSCANHDALHISINCASHIKKRAMIRRLQFTHLVFQSFKTSHTTFAVSLVCRKYWLTFNSYLFLLVICTSPVLNIAEEQVFVTAEVHARVTISFWTQGLAV